jgi:C-8 sterol isomerase
MTRYALDPYELRDLALQHVGKPVPQIAADLEHDLVAKYGNMIQTDMPWVLTPAGFVMYQVKMVFARRNEYLGLMGVPVASTGHTGRHPVTYYDTILSGGSRNASATDLIATDVKAGDFLVTRPWEAFTANIDDHIFFLEYCRGPLATIMPFGLANFVFGTLDLKSAGQIMRTNATLNWRSRGVSTPYRDDPDI